MNEENIKRWFKVLFWWWFLESIFKQNFLKIVFYCFRNNILFGNSNMEINFSNLFFMKDTSIYVQGKNSQRINFIWKFVEYIYFQKNITVFKQLFAWILPTQFICDILSLSKHNNFEIGYKKTLLVF